MIAVFLAGLVALTSPAPSATACTGSDISVTDLQIKVIKGSAKTSTDDRLLITGTFKNVGSESQQPHLAQHAELLRDGNVVATQILPALAAGVEYPLQFRIFRATTERTDPVMCWCGTCSTTNGGRNAITARRLNDSLQKTF